MTKERILRNLEVSYYFAKTNYPDMANAIFRSDVCKWYQINTKNLPSEYSVDSDLDKLADFLLKCCNTDDSAK